jgi:hypothetical protein
MIRHLAWKTKYLLLEAFDGMAYIIWSRVGDTTQ